MKNDSLNVYTETKMNKKYTLYYGHHGIVNFPPGRLTCSKSTGWMVCITKAAIVQGNGK